MIRRVLRNSADSSTPNQQVSVDSSHGETHSDVECLETYGLTSHPPANVNEGLALFLGGQSDHGVVVGWFDKAGRPKGLTAGEVKIYSSFGQSIYLNKDGEIIVTDGTGSTVTLSKNGDVTIAPSSLKTLVTGNLFVSQNIIAQGGIGTGGQTPVAGDVSVSGNVNVRGRVDAVGDVLAGAISLDHHTHLDHGDGAPQ